MTTTRLAVVGAKVLQAAFTKFITSAEQERARGKWYVVTVVDYAQVLEFGSRHMPARPHWRVAMEIMADDIKFSKKEQEDMLNGMIAGGNLRRDMALRLVKRIRALIRSGGMVKTGNYLASIAMGPTEGAALASSFENLLDPSTSVIFTNSAGSFG